ncbi:alpha-2-macroglobulin [Dyadobacter sp. CY326]|uniref:alpha-2-macroglobulin family protein n=1 Tax=Dyadobacter sp. CY326 TaxID=2907300 RepID=UPI001F45A6DE|nr:alpha-2-macroglobulin family protein [Dyadobacter sp. CY326]MCE7066232.1 MG2 domain-containing protein [Dyadobacter sp. CY326]
MKIFSHNLRYFLIFLMCYSPMHAQGQDKIKTYDAQWKVVAGHQKNNLPKSALEEVKRIYDLAKKENQDAQVIKAAVFMINLQTETREDDGASLIAELEKEVAASRQPAKSILSNLLALSYYGYYQNVRWKIYERTATIGSNKDDISTWATEDFHQKISTLYLESIANETLLKQTRLEPYDAIIAKGNARNLRPTLYDLLTQKALNYFASDERDIKKPSYAFVIDKASAFDPAADFIHRKFETKDSTSLEFFALQLYQKLIAFHINDPQPDALIDVDIMRLQFVRQKSIHPDADSLYYMAISHLAGQYQQTPAAAQAWYLKAAYHDENGNTYKAGGDSTHRFEKKIAVSICEKIIAENPETEGGINAFNLLNSIKRQDLQFTTEQVNIPEKPFLTFLEYKNLRKLHLRIVKTTDAIKMSFQKYDMQEIFKSVGKLTPIRTWEQQLPDTKDYQQHGVEIKVEGLPVGEYVLFASSEGSFAEKRGIQGVRMFYVSNISYLQRHSDIFVLDRETGQPLAGANVTIWNSKYDYATRAYKSTKSATLQADKNGYVKDKTVISKWEERNQMLEIMRGNDKLFIEEQSSTYYNDAEQDVESKIYLFTDRSLYRPGQTVYYKAIVADGKNVLKDQTKAFKIALQNANNEQIEQASKTVNAFGSFNGTFVLPQGTLNGQFSIVADGQTVFFHVEEYKKPKFAVQFDTLRGTYKLGDTIKVTGIGTAYSGNFINGAKVTYRVVRSERFLYPWFYKSRYFPTAEPQEIVHGETITDASGKFHIDFEAIPNAKTNKNIEPVFDFTVYADVTDINGETRSAQTHISVGYKSVMLKADIPEKIAIDSLNAFKIRTENMNGEFVSAPITVKIFRITPENRLIRPRYWQNPDLFVMTKAEFIAAFPHDEYDNETEQESWPVQNVIFEKTAMLTENEKFLVEKWTLTAGFYKIELITKDDSGAEVKDVKFTEITDIQATKLAYPQYISAENSEAIEPGEKTTVKLATSASDVFVISSAGRKRNPDSFSFFRLSNEKRTFDISANEADRGGYGIDYMFVKHNRVHQHQELVDVPWTNKDLRIEYETFRDKTLPGSKEQWKVRISGYKKDKVAAEMLAGMYDASLDQFYPHQWSKPEHWPIYPGIARWSNGLSFAPKDGQMINYTFDQYKSFEKRYDQLMGTHIPYNRSPRGGGRRIQLRGSVTQKASDDNLSNKEIEESVVAETVPIGQDAAELSKVVTIGYGVKSSAASKPANEPLASTIRKNFNETAFFLPDLKTDKNGAITFSFTMPEALTRWKFQALAHTKDMALGYSSKEILTQKDLMIQPNPPRFLREGDQIVFSGKVANLSEKALSGKIALQLFDTETNEPIDALFANNTLAQDFSVEAGQSTAARFAFQIPKDYSKTITWRMTAKAGNFSDAEENILPVLSNRMLVTETMPLSMRGTGSKQFKFQKLLDSQTANTLTNHSLTIEYASNPAWFAVQALPYLMEYPYDCAEQTWNRYYANSLAATVVTSSPRIAQIFEKWRKSDTTALLSNLQKNLELKVIVLEETPWVLAAKTESEQKKNIALLFDLLRMTNELSNAAQKLRQLQSSNGGFVWFKGGPDDRYMTQYILTGIGHLRKSNAVQKGQETDLEAIIKAALPYLDARIADDYNDLLKHKQDMKAYNPSQLVIQYLYMRSFFKESVAASAQKAFQYFMERTRLSWTVQTKYMQGMSAIVLHRANDKATPAAILKSLKETAINHEEMGMYWKNNQRGWWWYEAPIERQALLIEAFQEIGNDVAAVDGMKTWLLKNKQTNNWESTKATAEACYALLMTGSNWLAANRTVTVSLAETKLDAGDVEAGTGYFKTAIAGKKITAAMGDIKVNVSGESDNASAPSWGAVYWQYFEDLDKITFSETPLKLSKKLFIERNSDRGPVLMPVNEGDMLHVGDKVKVRIELRADRDMEYVHMKDMRASGLEPVNVLSSYKWQDGLGYYESTKDASTNFFFNSLRKGTYVFEYALFINQEGNFSNGITTIQCMYAPEFTAHSEGIRIRVGK